MAIKNTVIVIFDLRSSIVKSILDCRLSSVRTKQEASSTMRAFTGARCSGIYLYSNV